MASACGAGGSVATELLAGPSVLGLSAWERMAFGAALVGAKGMAIPAAAPGNCGSGAAAPPPSKLAHPTTVSWYLNMGLGEDPGLTGLTDASDAGEVVDPLEPSPASAVTDGAGLAARPAVASAPSARHLSVSRTMRPKGIH